MTNLSHKFLVSMCLLITLFILPFQASAQDIQVELGGIGFDMEIDQNRNQFYVSVPALNEIVVISMSNYQVTERVVIGSRPHGIDLSHDGNTLFVALNQAGAVAFLDLNTMQIEEVLVGNELGSSLAYDVVAGKPNRVYVSANPSSGGLSWIVMINRDQNNHVSRVASNRIIRADPVFAESPDQQFLYIGAGFSPNSLYKLDITVEEAPIILEDNHGSVSGTDHLAVSPDGTRIYLRSGQVLRTGSFVQAGLIGSGLPAVNSNGSQIYVGQEPNRVEIYDALTFLKINEQATSCVFNNLQQIMVLSNDAGWLLLGDDLLCGMSNLPIGPALTVSPPTGEYLSNQKFDLALLIRPGDTLVEGFESVFVGSTDMTTKARKCSIPGTLPNGGVTYRCRGFSAKLKRLGLIGTQAVTIQLRLVDGSLLSQSETWEILPNVE